LYAGRLAGGGESGADRPAPGPTVAAPRGEGMLPVPVTEDPVVADSEKPRRLSPAEAAALVRTRDSLAVPLGTGQPRAFLDALGERQDWEELRVFGALLTGLHRVFTRPGVRLLSAFFGPVERGLRDAGYDVHFVPGDFRRFGPILRRLHPRVLATSAAPPEPGGRISLSLHAGASVAEILAAGRDPERLLVVEVGPAYPRTLGLPPAHPHAIPLELVDVLVESEATPLELPHAEPSASERAIAAHAVRFVRDGSTIQTGIGGVPSAVAGILAAGPGGDYGIHTEMFTDGCLALHEAGKVSNRKGVFDGTSICTFAAGSRRLYDWLDGNQDVRFLPVDKVNDPSVIARQRRFVSINSALAVDLVGQVAADTIDGRQFSGIGGHEDFLQGAAFSEGGRSLLCLPATATVDGRKLSRIQATFAPGAVVTGPRHQVDAIITENGVAELAARTVEERAESLIAIADPDFQDGLREEFERLRKHWRA